MRTLIDYLGGLVLFGGDHDGERFTVLPWQGRFCRGAFRQPGDAAVTCPRGNGKSALVAGIASAVVDPAGPLTGPRREVVVVASSFAQGRIVYEDVLAFLGGRYDLGDRSAWRTQDSQNVAILEYRSTGARVRCLGRDPARAHSIRPALAPLDEGAQWPATTGERMPSAARTLLGKTPGSKLIALGTRPADSAHWFARLLESAPYSQVHAAPPYAPSFQVRTWRRANPSLDHLPSLREQIATEAAQTRRDPVLLASFTALRLNGGTSDTEQSLLLDAGLWASIEGTAAMAGPACWGIDLGTSAAQSAVACFGPQTGALATLAAFPAEPDLTERGIRDGVAGLYAECRWRGELLTVGRRTVPVADLLEAALARFGRLAVVVADRWREGELRHALEAARIPLADLVVRGIGYRDGGEDTLQFRRACADGRVVSAPSLLLRSAMAEARTVSEPAGNTKLSKGSQGGWRLRARDDAACAAILAVAEGVRQFQQRPQRSRPLRTAPVG